MARLIYLLNILKARGPKKWRDSCCCVPGRENRPANFLPAQRCREAYQQTFYPPRRCREAYQRTFYLPGRCWEAYLQTFYLPRRCWEAYLRTIHLPGRQVYHSIGIAAMHPLLAAMPIKKRCLVGHLFLLSKKYSYKPYFDQLLRASSASLTVSSSLLVIWKNSEVSQSF